MNRKVAAIIGLQAIIIVILFWVLVFYGKDEYEAYTHGNDASEIESKPHITNENGAVVVTLSSASQQQSGIVSQPLNAASHQTSLSSYGMVIGIDPLIELRTRYLSARADANVVRSSIANSQQEYQRMLQLNRDNKNVSDRALASAEVTLKSDQARVTAAETAANSLRDSIRQQWGETLATWVTGASGEPLQRRHLGYRANWNWRQTHQRHLYFACPTNRPNATRQNLLLPRSGGKFTCGHARFHAAGQA
jgi:hypothetical protein